LNDAPKQAKLYQFFILEAIYLSFEDSL